MEEIKIDRVKSRDIFSLLRQDEYVSKNYEFNESVDKVLILINKLSRVEFAIDARNVFKNGSIRTYFGKRKSGTYPIGDTKRIIGLIEHSRDWDEDYVFEDKSEYKKIVDKLKDFDDNYPRHSLLVHLECLPDSKDKTKDSLFFVGDYDSEYLAIKREQIFNEMFKDNPDKLIENYLHPKIFEAYKQLKK